MLIDQRYRPITAYAAYIYSLHLALAYELTTKSKSNNGICLSGEPNGRRYQFHSGYKTKNQSSKPNIGNDEDNVEK